MVHPDVPCVLFTPLNPHSLSFRPLVLPNSITLRLQVGFDLFASSVWSFLCFQREDQTNRRVASFLMIWIPKVTPWYRPRS